MKKLFTSLTFFSCLFYAGAQVCSPTPPLSEPKFDPKPDSVRCMVRNQAYDQTFKFRIPDKAGNFTINWMAIDSVTNIPAGITYQLNKPLGSQYNANETGCVKLSGTPIANAGQYRLGIWVRIRVNNTLTLPGEIYEVAKSQNVSNASDYIIWIRVKEQPGNTCPCIDTSRVARNDVKPYTGNETQCPEFDPSSNIANIAGSISGLNIAPNPVSNVAIVEFFADKNAVYTAKISNLIGKEVYRKNVEVKAGPNIINFNRNDLPGGVYFFTLTDGKGQVTKRFIIE
ncbi:MAG: T9SS type A sorting domain-containing protein [Chitinophagales bacterium]|nr:T9SS type A sorting domain-containing protein [Chitinophagales bacterium]MDW8273105.1 T9SS type A sorting domain-containing protein [Chitinophagales bacterium]